MAKRGSERVGKAGSQSTRRKAEEYAKDPERVRRLLDDAAKKAERLKGRLSDVWDSLMGLMRLVRAWVNGTYRPIPWTSIILAIGALIYFVMPFDFIPDFIVGLGLVDDAAVIAWVVIGM